METFEGLGSVRTEPAPRRTIKCYKLMRLVDGKLYPLYIDNSAPVELGVWYNADSPDFDFLKTLPAGYHLIEGKNTLIKSQSHAPKEPDEVREATAKGQRWIKIVVTKLPQRRYKGESRAYYNVGISQSTKKIKRRGVVVGLKVEDEVNENYAMRAGWHAGSLPTMRQVFCKPNGVKRNRDNYVFVEGEISADIDYNAEAQQNPEKDLPDKMPVNGWYLKATNADKDAAQADRVGWYVAGAIKLNRIISDSEAHAIIDRFNAEHPDDEPVLYQWPRESGRMFNADTMSLEGLHGTKKAETTLQGLGWFYDSFRPMFYITDPPRELEEKRQLLENALHYKVEINKFKEHNEPAIFCGGYDWTNHDCIRDIRFRAFNRELIIATFDKDYSELYIDTDILPEYKKYFNLVRVNMPKEKEKLIAAHNWNYKIGQTVYYKEDDGWYCKEIKITGYDVSSSSDGETLSYHYLFTTPRGDGSEPEAFFIDNYAGSKEEAEAYRTQKQREAEEKAKAEAEKKARAEEEEKKRIESLNNRPKLKKGDMAYVDDKRFRGDANILDYFPDVHQYLITGSMDFEDTDDHYIVDEENVWPIDQEDIDNLKQRATVGDKIEIYSDSNLWFDSNIVYVVYIGVNGRSLCLTVSDLTPTEFYKSNDQYNHSGCIFPSDIKRTIEYATDDKAKRLRIAKAKAKAAIAILELMNI